MVRKPPSQSDDSTVRFHRADGTITVTRPDETDEVIIKSRGPESRDTWTRRVPRFRHTVETGEHLWRIPGNWDSYYRLKSVGEPDKVIYHIPESNQFLLLSRCNPHARIADAYHTVDAVGDITWTAHADVDQVAIRDVLSSFYCSQWDDEEIRTVLQYVRDNPRQAVKSAEERAADLAPEYVENWRGIPESRFDPFQESFISSNQMVQHPDYEPESTVMMHLHDHLGSVIPPSPLVSVTVE